jgi:Ca2+-binding RTX toxin-like protein
MTRRTLAAVLTTGLLLLLPAAAQAHTTFTYSAARITVTNDGAGGTVSLYTLNLQGDDGNFHDFPAFTLSDPAPSLPPDCGPYNGYVVCSTTDSFLFQGAGGADNFAISDDPALNSLAATLIGNGGNDQLKDFSAGDRTLDGGAGNDVMFGSDGDDILRGGPGNDDVDGEGGSDNVSGGEGDDKVDGDHLTPAAPDVVDGGPGVDKLADGWGSADGPVSLTLDGVANDGRAGEGDNVVGVESIEGGAGTYVGSDAAETFLVGATGEASSVSAGGGNDDITTGNGNDTVDGGAGDDRIVGGFDNDTITGGPGRDAIFADSTGSYCGYFTCTVPFGNDVVNARDGEADSIDCGVGADRAVTDRIDTVANCETNDAAGPGPGGPGGGSGGGGSSKDLTVVTKRSIRQIARKGLKIRVTCPAACTIRARIVTKKALARKLRLPRNRQLASARKSLLSAGTATLTLKVAKKAKRRFRRLRKATVTLKVTRTGADKKATTFSRTLRLKR